MTGVTVDVLRLRESFYRTKKTYNELALETGIDRRHLSDILNGKRRSVSREIAVTLSETFNIPIEEMIVQDKRGVYEYNIMRGLKSLSDEEVFMIKEYIMDLRELKGLNRLRDKYERRRDV